MNYISLDTVVYAAAIMRSIKDTYENPDIPDETRKKVRFVCEYGTDNPEAWERGDFPPCKNPPEFLIPDATWLSAGGSIEQHPGFFCREHTRELIGEEPKEQPAFDRVLPPDEFQSR